MSVQKFADAVKGDKVLQDELTAATKQSLLSIANKHGFNLTEKDLDENQKDHAQAAGLAPCTIMLTKTVTCTTF